MKCHTKTEIEIMKAIVMIAIIFTNWCAFFLNIKESTNYSIFRILMKFSVGICSSHESNNVLNSYEHLIH